MEIQTIQRYLHTSPRKLRLVADMVRKMTPIAALNILRITPKYAAKDLSKAIETVLANAKQAGIDGKNISFKKIEVDESIKMRRFHAGTRGRVKPFKRKMAHIKIVLTDEINLKTQNAKLKTNKKEVESEKLENQTAIKDITTKTEPKKKGKTQSSK